MVNKNDAPAGFEIPSKSLDQDKKITIVDNWYGIANRAQGKWEQQAREDLDFVIGKQWAAEDLKILKEQKRPALTFNHLISLANLVSGYERQNRTDIRALPRKGGTGEVARILNNILKDILYGCEGEFEQSLSYLMGIIVGKSFLGLDISMDDDPINGQIIIENISPFQIRIDPFHMKYDLSDADYLFRHAWLSKMKIARMFPNSKAELMEMKIDDEDKTPIYGKESSSYKENSASGEFEIDLYRYRVKQCYWREYEKQTLLVNPSDGRVFRPDLPQAAIKKILQRRPNLKKVERVLPRLNVITKVGSVILEEIEDPFNGIWRYPIIPFFAYWFEDEFFGIIKNLKDPQREINKRSSQMLHHLNQSANSGEVYEEGTIVNEDDLHDVGTKPGFKIIMKKGTPRDKWPYQRQPTSLSQGHLVISEVSAQQIPKISGLNVDLQGGKPERQESGVAMEQRRRAGLIIIESLFDNYRRTKRILGKRLLEFIQKAGTYSRDEVINLVVDGKPVQEKINQKQYNNFGMVEKVLNDVTVGRYDAIIDEAPNTATARMANFVSMLEALKIGIPIPPEMIVKNSDWPHKEEIEQAVSTQQQAQQAMEENEGLKKRNEKLVKSLNSLQLELLKKIAAGREELVDLIAKLPTGEGEK